MDDNNRAYGKILTYMDYNPIATLGTLNPDGSPHGAAVYISADDRHRVVYFLTKTGTRKYKNLSERDQVSLTIVSPTENSTVQANGRAFVTREPHIIDTVTQKINRTYAASSDWLPPVAKIRAGAYVIVGIAIQHARLAQYQGMEIGDTHIFTEA